MAEENQQKIETTTTPVVGDQGVEVKERGYFDFLRTKKEDKPQEEAIASEFGEKVKISETEHKPVENKEEEEKEKQHGSLLEKLQRTSSGSSSSDEEEGEGEEKKKKKKEKKHGEDVTIPVEKVDEPVPEENKGFLARLKESLPAVPGKKTEEVPPPSPPIPLSTESAATTHEAVSEGEVKEQKGFVLDEIKEKIPRTPPSTESSAATTETVAREEEAKEEKGFLEKIKESTPPSTPPSTECTETIEAAHEGEAKEKKGFLQKIKDKIPSSTPPSTESAATTEAAHEDQLDAKEKKGFLDKIKGKIHGYHSKTEEEKEKEKDSAAR